MSIDPDRNHWYERLAQDARVMGARMLRDDDVVTDEIAGRIIAGLKEYLETSGRTMAWAARSLGMKPSVLSQVCSRTYAADDEAHIRALDKWVGHQRSRVASELPEGFVRTRVAELVHGVAKFAVEEGGIALVHGWSGLGKTMALQALAAEIPGTIYFRINTTGQSKLSVLAVLANALKLPPVRLTGWELFRQLQQELEKSGRLIVVDEMHKLVGKRKDEGLHALRDLYDVTGCPMVWAGMSNLAHYIQQGKSDNYEPLDQVHSRVSIWLDLAAKAVEGFDGGDGLYTVEQIRKVMAAGKLRITGDGVTFLRMFAHTEREGGLREARWLLKVASRIARGAEINAELLRSALSEQRGARVAERVDLAMSRIAAAG
jgi:DNA transposition AAA+ family ATPase